jgi:hypothetical protein
MPGTDTRGCQEPILCSQSVEKSKCNCRSDKRSDTLVCKGIRGSEVGRAGSYKLDLYVRTHLSCLSW